MLLLQVDDAVRVMVTNSKFNGMVPGSLVSRPALLNCATRIPMYTHCICVGSFVGEPMCCNEATIHCSICKCTVDDVCYGHWQVYRAMPTKSGSIDIAKWLVPGANRIVLEHVDDKCNQATLW